MWNNGRRAAVPSGDRTSVNIVEYPVSDESCKQEANGVRWWIVMIAAFAAGGGHARTAASTPAYPERPVRFIVPLAPGGSVDIMARSVAEWLTEALGQQVVADNRPGAGGTIGAQIAARAAPDGYTMVMGSSSTFGVNPALYRRPGYDAIKDFAPVVFVSFAPNALVVHPSLPARSVAELVAYAKARPGQINFASSGTGGAPHLAGELFKLAAGIDIVHVPYKGTGQALADLLGGQVQMSFGTVLAVLPHVKAGKLRALGVTSAKRAPALPGVPSMTEAGFPAVNATSWNGILVPVRTERRIVERLNREVNRMLSAAGVRERLLAQGAEPGGGSPEEFASFIRNEIAKWGKVVAAIGLRVE